MKSGLNVMPLFLLDDLLRRKTRKIKYMADYIKSSQDLVNLD